jgi:endoglucanase
MEEILKELSEAKAIAGFEDEVQEILIREFKKCKLKVEKDEFGNVIAYKKITKKPLVLAAHMDEIGLSVKYIDNKGFIRFIKIGGIDDRSLINQRVVVKTKNGYVRGIIGLKPPHLMGKEEAKSFIEYKNMFIDIGAKSKKEVDKLGIMPGSPIFFEAEFFNVLNNKCVGKALDNRVGCYILLKIASSLVDNVVLLGTAQEEVSVFGKGATIAAYNLEPRAFIAVDTAIAGDHPEVKEDEAPISLEKGPVITLIEAAGIGNIASRKLTSKIIEIAKKLKIPYQLETIEGGATDAASVYNVKGGIPSIAICVPTRYIHSNVSMASYKDIELCTKLLKELIKHV